AVPLRRPWTAIASCTAPKPLAQRHVLGLTLMQPKPANLAIRLGVEPDKIVVGHTLIAVQHTSTGLLGDDRRLGSSHDRRLQVDRHWPGHGFQVAEVEIPDTTTR